MIPNGIFTWVEHGLLNKGTIMLKVVGYVRCSTEEQATNGQTLDAQIAKLKAYAALYDLALVEIVVDAGVSAKNVNREGLQKALGMIRTGAADGLLICKLCRLTRNIGDWQDLIDAYFGEKAGKQLFSVADSIDTRTAAGRLVLNVLLSVAQWERETIGERTKDALQHKITKGERCGRIRFGYDLAADGVNLVPNALEQEAIGIMRALRAAGESYRAIATQLDARGVMTKDGRPWKHTSVKAILARAA